MGLGTVTSVSFTGDGVVLATTADTPVTGSGTLTPSLISQAKNVVSCGTVDGFKRGPDVSVACGGRPAGGMGLGTVTSVSFTGDGVVLAAMADTPVTGLGTLTPSLISQAKNVVLCGTVDGFKRGPDVSVLAAADLPSIPNASLANSSVTITAGTGLSGGGAFSLGSSVNISNAGVTAFTGDGTVLSNSASTGGVTASLASQAKNVVLAGPLTGSIAAPTFRALAAADLPAGMGLGTVTSVSFTGDGWCWRPRPIRR